MKKLLLALLLLPSFVQAALVANVTHGVVTTYTDGSAISATSQIKYRYYFGGCLEGERQPVEIVTDGGQVLARIDVTNLPVGQHVLYATASEVLAGGEIQSECSNPSYFVIDNKKPNAPINIEVLF